VWELIFLMVILKIPIVYLCWIVYWAIKAEPEPQEPDAVAVRVPDAPTPPNFPRRRRTLRPVRPHGGPARRYTRTSRAAATTGRR
jgi:hypothetical protein